MQLRLDGVHKRYGDTVALDGLDLVLEPGTRLLLAGANGAGKTTVLRLLAGLTAPSRGQVRVDGQDPRRSLAARRQLGLLSHQTLLYDDLTAAENLRLFARLYGLDPVTGDTALERVGLQARRQARVDGLSRGMKQRLALARATLHEPRVLLLDEPFTGLDRAGARWLAADLQRQAAENTRSLVMVTHNVQEAAGLANRVVVLRHGRVACDQAWSGDGHALQALCDRHLEGSRP